MCNTNCNSNLLVTRLRVQAVNSCAQTRALYAAVCVLSAHKKNSAHSAYSARNYNNALLVQTMYNAVLFACKNAKARAAFMQLLNCKHYAYMQQLNAQRASAFFSLTQNYNACVQYVQSISTLANNAQVINALYVLRSMLS